MAQETNFDRGEAIHLVNDHNTFSQRDTGITNPYADAYIKVTEGGEIEVYAGNGTGIFMNPHSRSITFMADSLRFITRDEDGIRWNDKLFNDQATIYTEPFLVPYETDNSPSPYKNMEQFLDDNK